MNGRGDLPGVRVRSPVHPRFTALSKGKGFTHRNRPLPPACPARRSRSRIGPGTVNTEGSDPDAETEEPIVARSPGGPNALETTILLTPLREERDGDWEIPRPGPVAADLVGEPLTRLLPFTDFSSGSDRLSAVMDAMAPGIATDDTRILVTQVASPAREIV